MRSLLLPFALSAAFAPAAAIAQDSGRFMQREQTRAEAQQRADMLFEMLDANKDGTVTKAEAEQALAKMQAARGGPDNGGRAGGRFQRMIDQAFATTRAMTLQQFEAQSLARFDATDFNHDGTVTATERQLARVRQSQASGNQ